MLKSSGDLQVISILDSTLGAEGCTIGVESILDPHPNLIHRQELKDAQKTQRLKILGLKSWVSGSFETQRLIETQRLKILDC